MAGRVGNMRRFFNTTTTSFPWHSPSSVPTKHSSPPSTNLFISGLNKWTTSEKLMETFSQFGEVIQARVATDRVSGFSKGFGFVRYATIEEGIKGMDGQYLEGWVIFAEDARPIKPPSQQR